MRQKQLLWILALLAIALSTHAQNASPYWSLAGNSNASNTTSKLGTTNAINLRLYTNNLERMRILSSNGYVGIGTLSPTDRLHINSATGTNPFRAQVNGSTKLMVHSGGGVSIGSNLTPPANGLYVSGNLGIGTGTPNSKLQVVGSSTAGTGIYTTGYDYGLQVYSMNAEFSYAVYASSPQIGVYGYGGSYGTYGSSTYIGAYGDGTVSGTYGYSSSGTAATGYSNTGTGVYGFSQESYGGLFESTNGNAIQASTATGAYAGAFYGNVYLSNGYTTSDKNLKHNIKEFTGAMGIISKLKPQQYQFKTDMKYAFLHLPQGSHYGLMAQDLELVLPNLVSEASHEFGGSKPKAAIKPSKDGKPAPVVTKEKDIRETLTIKAVNYTELIAIIIKGMQEQGAENKALKEQVEVLNEQMTELRKIVMELKNGSAGRALTTTSAYLEQNTPNPVSGTTIIRYTVSSNAGSAKLNIINAKGQVVKTIAVNKGIGQVNLNTAMLASGTYNYTLYVDGKQVDTKRLIIAR